METMKTKLENNKYKNKQKQKRKIIKKIKKIIIWQFRAIKIIYDLNGRWMAMALVSKYFF